MLLFRDLSVGLTSILATNVTVFSDSDSLIDCVSVEGFPNSFIALTPPAAFSAYSSSPWSSAEPKQVLLGCSGCAVGMRSDSSSRCKIADLRPRKDRPRSLESWRSSSQLCVAYISCICQEVVVRTSVEMENIRARAAVALTCAIGPT